MILVKPSNTNGIYEGKTIIWFLGIYKYPTWLPVTSFALPMLGRLSGKFVRSGKQI